MKKVKNGASYKMVPRKVYTYNSVKSSITKLFLRPDLKKKFELWRKRVRVPEFYCDIYDGVVWQILKTVHGRPFLQLPNNLGFILNIDWFSPFKHIEYSIGVIYLVISNLPRSLRYKLENIIIVGILPGPNEPKKNMNSYLKPLVDELTELWSGYYIRSSDMFLPIRCALMCVSCNLPATHKLCGFTSYSSTQGCSKCMKKFTSESFGEKVDYSGYNRDTWPPREHLLHLQQVD